MALSPGTRFGPYEIADEIGAGGMGVVYRATDTNLKRDVAIKVLPESLATDAERLARFQREAEILASLNHPNIAQIHGLEKADGTTALVMELVEGPTLADRIEEGAFPVDEALGIAMQIAQGLEGAHSHGIVHRDLKPANIKLRPDGTVKVLDFGIAKALEPDLLTSAPKSPMLTTPATMAGVILGTAAYMSPEQARGKPVDQRADIWAFGCVLYEMLTGQPAFGGEDVPLTLARVLDRDTDMDSLPAAISPAVRQTIQLCLQKDVRMRVADIRDVRLALEGAFESVSPQVAEAGSVAQPVWRRPLPIAVAALIVGGVLAGLTAWSLKPPPDPGLVSRFPVILDETQQFTEDENGVVDISRDGTQIAYAADNQIWLRDLGEMLARPIQGIDAEERPTYPVFSPDGQSLLYLSDRDLQLRKISVVGGTPITLTDSLGDDPQGLYWDDDGTILYVPEDGNIMGVSSNGGIPDVIIEAAEGEELHGAWMLPGGEWLLFTVTTSSGPTRWDEGQIVVQSLVTGERRLLWQGGSDARYVPTGHLVYALDNDLFVLPFDLTDLVVTGGPTPVAAGVKRSTVLATDSATANYSFSDNGSLVYIPGVGSSALRALFWVDRDGRAEPIAAEPREYILPRISPDGRRVALDVRGGQDDIFVWDFVDETLTRLTFDAEPEQDPVWTLDGERIAYRHDRDIYWKASNNTGTATPIAENPTEDTGPGPAPYFFSPGGTELVFADRSTFNNQVVLRMIPVDGSTEPARLLRSEFNEANAALSPDGRWMAYQSNESGRAEIYVQPFPNVDDGRWQISNAGGIYPVWSRNTNELFYVQTQPNATMIAAEFSGDPTFVLGARRELFDSTAYVSAGTLGRTYDVSADGDRFLMIAQTGQSGESSAPQINVVLNWFEELKRLAPAAE